MNYWDWMPVTGEGCHLWQIGPLKLWLRRQGDEWHMAVSREPQAAEELLVVGQEMAAPEGLPWKRWVLPDERRQVRLLPVLPDRPLVVRPESPMTIPIGRDCVFYAGLALWARIQVGPEEPTALGDVPMIIQSNTWFGDPTAGELAYSMRTSARRDLLNLPPRPQRARCAVTLRNRADCNLDFTRLCLRTSHSSLYHGQGMLWASSVTMDYLGGTGNEMRADTEIGDYPPEAAPATLVTEPREAVESGLLARLQNLRSFSL